MTRSILAVDQSPCAVPVTVTLPYPPSANRYWRKFRGNMVVSAEAKAYREVVATRLYGVKPYTGDVSLTVGVYRPQKSGDLDGRLKQLLDALQGYLYVDDKQIVRIVADRYDDKANPRVEVTVAEIAL
jgi:crossover junction endodeoxyribonuclease RusA